MCTHGSLLGGNFGAKTQLGRGFVEEDDSYGHYITSEILK